MSKEFIKWFNNTRISGDVCPGSNKKKFKLGAKKLFENLAQQLNLKKEEYEIRFNAAGPAVCGEAVFHTNNFYVQISQFYCTNKNVLFRKCNGRKDYSGGTNNFTTLSPELWEGKFKLMLESLKN